MIGVPSQTEPAILVVTLRAAHVVTPTDLLDVQSALWAFLEVHRIDDLAVLQSKLSLA